MDFTTNKLLAACYLVATLFVCVLGYLFVQSQAAKYAVPSMESRTVSLARASTDSGSRAIPRRLRFDLERQRDQIRELQNVLQKREAILKQQSAQLANQSANQETLQQEADRYLDMLYAMVQQSSDLMDSNLQMLDEDQASEDEAYRDDAASDDAPDGEALEGVLEAAQWELRQKEDELAESAEATIIEMQKAVAVRQAIANSGALAVPMLTTLLTDSNAEVRTWSAQTLGSMGVNASSAMDALLKATNDESTEVATAARVAADAISAAW